MRQTGLRTLRMDRQNRIRRHLRTCPAGRRYFYDRERLIVAILIQKLCALLLMIQHQRNRLRRIHRRSTANSDDEIDVLPQTKLPHSHHHLDRRIFLCLIENDYRRTMLMQRTEYIHQGSVLRRALSGHNQCFFPERCPFLTVPPDAASLAVYFCGHIKMHAIYSSDVDSAASFAVSSSASSTAASASAASSSAATVSS